MQVLAEGYNFRITLEGSLVRCVVWATGDLDAARGATGAEEMVRTLESLAARGDVRGTIFDIQGAPPVAGPRTLAALTRMLGEHERVGKRIAVQIGPSPSQRLQMTRVARDAAARVGRIVSSTNEAMAWVNAVRSSRPPLG